MSASEREPLKRRVSHIFVISFGFICVGDMWWHTHPNWWEGAWMGSAVQTCYLYGVWRWLCSALMWMQQDLSEHFFTHT